MEKSLNNDITTQALKQRLRIIRENVRTAAMSGGFDPDAVRLMAVTKYVQAPAVNRAVEAGITLIGENREQSLAQKYGGIDHIGTDIHFIGRLQRNKAAKVVRMVSTVQSLDSAALAAELDKQAALAEKNLSVLVQVNIGRDPNKTGLHPGAVEDFVDKLREYKNLTVRGLMTILPLNATVVESERYFSQMHALYVDMKAKNGDNINMDCLSMGMSGDYKLAVKHGATMIRLGTVLFG